MKPITNGTATATTLAIASIAFLGRFKLDRHSGVHDGLSLFRSAPLLCRAHEQRLRDLSLYRATKEAPARRSSEFQFYMRHRHRHLRHPNRRIADEDLATMLTTVEC